MPTPSWRTQPLPNTWHNTRKKILYRDQHTCQTCGNTATHIDHIKPASQGGTDTPDNLQALCRNCHNTKTSNEANQAKQNKPKAQRPPEQHPGQQDKEAGA